jgi:peptide/nickel transport system permease protein
MGLRDIGDHLRRKPIRTASTGAVGSGATSGKLAEGGEAGEVTAGLRFYFLYLRKDRAALVGLVMIGVFLGWALVEGILQQVSAYTHDNYYALALIPSNPNGLFFNQKLMPPSLDHFPDFLFGTNYLGQSILARMMYAAPHDALASLLVVGSAILIGMLLGTTAGYFGGWLDEFLMRLTDAFLSLPGIVLAIAIATLVGGGFTALLYALIIVWWPTYARFFRGQALSLRDKAYVEASKLSGAGSGRILLRHIFPNSIDPIVAYATLDLGTVILTYSVLAFLGIGLTIGYPEWGAEASLGLPYFPFQWWPAIIPGVVIAAVVIAFTLVGDRLQDLIVGRMTY